MRIEKCWFCEGPVYPGHGICFVRNDAKVFRFCRSKCHKNFKLKRNPRKTAWTKAFRKNSGKEMAQDPVLEFERVRNRPTKYNREQMAKTIKIMKRIEDIKEARQKTFYEKRMKNARKQQVAEAVKELTEHRESTKHLEKLKKASAAAAKVKAPIELKVKGKQATPKKAKN
mmetsp:Transcript_13923/g.35564  ORF Transcript_13923/g.35564 Transcript_13923/m.35564 type:complete len:171 (+) Transcript_13923:93-605(+)|eukprot:CAMPEP_0177648842 /NCGR_PEP_ID=MMETSP0447-20121125/11046_1 /TAXON_ID=0 /ORGANISM="Stygamoeba regulata, Strain BSH-02190019" /LENGTH=170 /DNA_ID=CAMNT_0019151515 /DNA_START=135 /DNA_END=647 /DNA_ORIENTATION=+